MSSRSQIFFWGSSHAVPTTPGQEAQSGGQTAPAGPVPGWKCLCFEWLDPLLLLLIGLFLIDNMYPFLWWGDGPELLTAARCKGVAHPTGYPLYLVLLDWFFLLPFGSVAWKGNLFSVTSTLLGVFFLLRVMPVRKDRLWIALGWRLGILSLIASPIFQRQSSLAEVYALSFLFLAGILWRAVRFADAGTALHLILLAGLCGFAVGHHRLLGLMLPGLGLSLIPRLREQTISLRMTLFSGLVFGFCLFLPYTLLFMRAQGSPPLNWEDPSSLQNLWRIFSAEQFRIDQKVQRMQLWLAYEKGLAGHPWRVILAEIYAIPSQWWHQFFLSGFLIVPGVFWLYQRSARLLVSSLTAWFLPAFFVVQYQVGDRESFHFLPLCLVALGIGLGWGCLLERSRDFDPRLPAAGLVLAACFIIPVAFNMEKPGAVLMETPERISRRTLDEIPPGSTLFAVSSRMNEPQDYTYFPLLYQKEVAKRGQSVKLFSEAFLTTPWYEKTLAREGIPGDFFDRLEKGTPAIPLHHTTLSLLLKEDMPSVQSKSLEGKPLLGIYEVNGRYFFSNRDAMAALVAQSLLPGLLAAPLYTTARFEELRRYVPESIVWQEVLRLPVITEGFSGLDGLTVPSGKLYRFNLTSQPAP